MYTPEYKTKVEVQHTAYIEQFTGNRTHHFFCWLKVSNPPSPLVQGTITYNRQYGHKGIMGKK
jgi:hypothetical protein